MIFVKYKLVINNQRNMEFERFFFLFFFFFFDYYMYPIQALPWKASLPRLYNL